MRAIEKNMEPSELQHSEGNLSASLEVPPTAISSSPKQGGWITFPFIIGTVLGLSLAAGGWASNLIVFLITKFNVKSIKATQINNVILGCFSLFPIAGAIIADSFLGSLSVVTIFAFVSLLGTIMLTLTASIHSLSPPPCTISSSPCQTPSNLQFGILYTSLALASLGLGGTRFTIAALGADQHEKSRDQAIFFNWYFLALYISNIFSFTAIVFVEDNVGWGLGFGICVIANAIGLIVFLAGKRFYRRVRPAGSPLVGIARVFVAAIRKRKILGILGREEDYYFEDERMSKMENTAPTKRFRFLNNAALKTQTDRVSDGSYTKSWSLCTVQEVEDLKTLIKILPLWSSGIFLGTVIAMSGSFTVLQALAMNRHLTPHFQIPAGSFPVFNLLATAISIFLIDRLLLRHPSLSPPLRRIGAGHFINILSTVASAIVETRRLRLARTQNPTRAGSMSALWLVVPLAVTGVSEALQVPAQLALYYEEFPKSLKSTATAMVSLLIGIGFYVSTGITDSVRRSTGWLADNINDGRLDMVFWMLTVLGAVNFGYFLVCARLFKYRKVATHA